MTPDEQQDRDEAQYILGKRAALLRMLHHVLAELGYDSAETAALHWITEREAAIAQLRDVCDAFGDNDWDESLHLADIIDKHLARHLHENSMEDDE